MDTYRRYFWITLALLTGLRLFLISQFELSPDEAYYWLWSQHLDWSYYDQGPMLALVIRAFTSLAGFANEWSVRLGAVALSTLAYWVLFEFILLLFRSTRAAWYGFVISQAALLISAGSILMMHDSIMMCFWIICLYFFYRAIVASWTPGWIFGALALGLGALGKYTMALFVPCLLLYLILSPENRMWWRRPHLYLAGLITLVLVSPIIIWNHQHHWASFGHVGQLGGVAKAWSFSFKNVLEFLGGQIGVLTPCIGIFCLTAPFIGWKKWRAQHPDAKQYLYLACFSGPVLIFFFLLSWRTDVYANWPAPAYPAAIALLAGWLLSLLQTPKAPLAKKWYWVSISLGIFLTVLAHLEVAYAILPLTGNAANSVNRIRGWNAMAQETQRKIIEFQQQAPGPFFLAARRYQIAAPLTFYIPGHPEVQLLPLEKPAGNQYRFWDHSATFVGQNAIYICEDYWEVEHIQKNFERVIGLTPAPIYDNGNYLREIRIFFAYNFKPTITIDSPGVAQP